MGFSIETNGQKVKQPANKVIYRAVIKNESCLSDTKTITYRSSNGKTITYTPGYRSSAPLSPLKEKQENAVILFNTINKYFTGKDPNITPKEQVLLRADIAKQALPMSGISGNGYGRCIDIYEGFDFVLKTFSDEASEGGKNITPNEVYQIYEIFHHWTK